METVVFLVAVAAAGLVVGALGRLAVPGPDPMSIGQTMAVGLAASLISGLICWGIWGREWVGLAPAVLVAMGLVWLVRLDRVGPLGPRSRSRSRDDGP